MNTQYLGNTIISPQYLIDHTQQFQPLGRNTNDAFYDASKRRPNYGGCEGGYPIDMFEFMMQYGTGQFVTSDSPISVTLP